MDPDEIGGSCPRCDAEFRPGITECPDCGIPLLGAEEVPAVSAASEPPAVASADLDAVWTGVLRVVAAACAASALLTIIGAAVSTFATEIGGQLLRSSFEQRVQYFARVANPSLAVVVLVGAVAVAVGLRRRPGLMADHVIRWATFVACALVVVIAAAGAFEDARNLVGLPGAQRVWSYSGWLATAVLALTGAAVTDALPFRRGER